MKDLKQALERVIQRIIIPSYPEVLSFEVIPSIFSNILHVNVKIPRGYRDKARLMKLNSELKSLHVWSLTIWVISVLITRTYKKTPTFL